MSATKIRGNTQIMAGTITDAEIASDAAIALSKLEEAVIRADGGQAFTADQSMGSHKLTNVQDPTSDQDAATRAWVLAQLSGGVTPHATATRAATTANITLANEQTIDGVSVVDGDRVLVKNQSSSEDNGLYIVADGGSWTRADEFDSWSEVPGMLVSVEEGTANADTLWLSTADLGGTLDTTAITFIQLPGPNDIVAGNGLTRSGQTLNVVAGDGSIVANADEIHVGVSGSGAITGGGALAVAVDGSTIEINSNALRVKPGGIGETQLGAGVYQKVANIIVRETPSGSVNGSNVTFTLANTPIAGSEQVFLNGILQEPGSGNDYTISGGMITYQTAPQTGDRLRVSYLK